MSFLPRSSCSGDPEIGSVSIYWTVSEGFFLETWLPILPFAHNSER